MRPSSARIPCWLLPVTVTDDMTTEERNRATPRRFWATAVSRSSSSLSWASIPVSQPETLDCDHAGGAVTQENAGY